MVKFCTSLLAICLCFSPVAYGQDLPESELQVNLNSYFDSFDVKIVYPMVSYTRKLTESSTINARYLIDVISAASMKSHFVVDGVTSATEREDGGGDDTPDEVRQEVGLGITHLLAGGTLSMNLLHSSEHDYRSVTIAANYTRPFAKKNTYAQIGFVRSWDKVFPQIRLWKKNKDVYTTSLNMTQVLSKHFIAQAIYSYSFADGFQSDPYQVVQIIQGDEFINLEPIHPQQRTRQALGLRFNYKVDRRTAVHIGARHYWDDWDVSSFTLSLSLLQHFGDEVNAEIGFRNYVQNQAYFFKQKYDTPEEFMTVDSKLDEGFSNEFQFKLSLEGSKVPLVNSDKVQLNVKFNYYRRKTATPNWHRRTKQLHAYIMSLGVRYRF